MTTNRDDASETVGGELISNKTIRRHAHALADIARTGGRTNPKNHHPGNSPDARREMAIQHLTEAARTNRDDEMDDAQRDDATPAEHAAYVKARPLRLQARSAGHEAARDIAAGYASGAKFNRERGQAQRAAGRKIEASELDAQPEDHDMANVAELKSRLDKMREEIDQICDALADDDDDVRDDAESASERSAAASLGDYHRHGEHESEHHVRDDEDKEEEEHDAGEELDKGKEDEEHGEEAKGEEEEHEAGEEEAAARDDAESEAERSEASEEGHEHHDEEEAEHAEDRGDRSPTEMAEELTEADAMTSAEHAAAARKAWRTRRSDAQTDSDAEIRAKIARLEARLARATRPVSREERDAMAAAQARCDSVAQMFGLKAEPPLAGEHLDSYRRRLVAPLQKYSKRWEKTSLDRAPDDTFSNIEEQIYADAQAAAKLDGAPEAGRLVPVRSVDAAGRTITKFYGDPNAWMAPFKARGLSIRINGVGRRD